MNIDHLLSPTSEADPCGPDPDDFDNQAELYGALSQLETMLAGEVRNGVTQPPRWPAIQEEALKLALRTKHLRVAVILTESACINEGLEGFRDGLRLIREWSHLFWEHLHPREIRHTLIDSLSDSKFLVKPRRLTLASGLGGSFTLDDHDKAKDDQQSDDSDKANHSRLVLGVFQDTPRATHARNHAAAAEALEHAREIENIFDERGGGSEPVNLINLRDCLNQIVTTLAPYAKEPEAEPENSAEADGQPVARATAEALGINSLVDSRQKAGEQLEQIAKFFERTEPSSPIPYMLRRARRCIGKNFMELMTELSTDRANAVLILNPEDASEDSVKE